MEFNIKNVSELQQYLRSRGVAICGSRKGELVYLCQEAHRLSIDLDPDGLLECRSDIILSKLRVTTDSGVNVTLPLPSLLEATNDLSNVPAITSFDLLSYLSQSREYTYSSLRQYSKLEGYAMFKDGYVLDLKSGTFIDAPSFQHISFQVKPRTNAKDPTTGLPYYVGWIILSSRENSNPITGAYCCCRGGIDGYCRHVTAALFEWDGWVNGQDGEACTSKPCAWSKPKRNPENTATAVEVGDLNLSLSGAQDKKRPAPSAYAVPWPSVADLDNIVRRDLPDAVALDTIQPRPPKKKKTSQLHVPTPKDKLRAFISDHTCPSASCVCSEIFVKDYLPYCNEDLQILESATRGQNCNENWNLIRKYLLTSSNFKKICHSTDFNKTSKSLLKDSNINGNNPPPAIKYGRKNEGVARRLYMQGLKVQHKGCKQCKVATTGIIISQELPFIACSPDGIVSCKCETFLIEIKCVFSYRSFSPRVAGKMAGFIEEKSDGSYGIVRSHQYNYQIQGQMAVTKINKAILIIFTDKGIFPVSIPFDAEFWKECQKKLSLFYTTFYQEMVTSLLAM